MNLQNISEICPVPRPVFFFKSNVFLLPWILACIRVTGRLMYHPHCVKVEAHSSVSIGQVLLPWC